jgi:hypothetical protein
MPNPSDDGNSPDPHAESPAFPSRPSGAVTTHHPDPARFESPSIAPEPGPPEGIQGTSGIPPHSSIPTAGKKEVPTPHRADWDNWGVASTEHNNFSKVLFRLKDDRTTPGWTPWENDETVVEERTSGNDRLWSLGHVCTEAWIELRAQLRGMIKAAPGRSKNSSSPVVLQSYLVGDDKAHLRPIVYISASSDSYAKALRRAIKRSGVLDIDNVQFDVKVMDRHTEVSERPRMLKHTSPTWRLFTRPKTHALAAP